MSVDKQIQPPGFDFDLERGLEKEMEKEEDAASTSKMVLEEDTSSLLAEAIGTWDPVCVGELSRNTSLTTVSSSFPLSARIVSHHRWESESEYLRQASPESSCKCQLRKKGNPNSMTSK
ncbi:uncharacterized protein [Drosophila bipectinata]|uniref:uncharacterized protein n=1 Tax=Drosophila bipectinata TaxID=42026 RepID=UPI001C89DE0F|nr:uncharacterized protein LOC108133998 [Drosophila bipectinata]